MPLKQPRVLDLLAPVLARVFFPAGSVREDVLLIARAVNDPGIADVLPTITVPVLLVCGDRDNFVSVARYEETARLIPDATFTVYRGKGHLGAISDPRLAPDILDFAASNAEVSPPSTGRRVPAG
mgnify:FL=1